ncbi:MAG TPA: GNAT family protein [Candidatus Acidoferrum sp.]|nr:GNAT family protein [Candidatus Acidoferrum sp.]
MLEGKQINLRVMERDDIEFATECFNNLSFRGEYDLIGPQRSKTDRLRDFDTPCQVATLCQRQRFIIEKKDGTKIGFITHYVIQPTGFTEVGYEIVPSETGKGYGTEAVQLIVDYLFLSQNIQRIQAITDTRNKPSQRVLEKSGFQREGTIRNSGYVRGILVKAYLYSIIREEWKEPKILTKTS